MIHLSRLGKQDNIVGVFCPCNERHRCITFKCLKWKRISKQVTKAVSLKTGRDKKLKDIENVSKSKQW